MKKMLLLLVSGLLIACMAGSAMANPCNVDFSKYSFGIGSPGGDQGTVSVDQYLIQGTRTISVVTSDPSIEAQIVGITGWASGSSRQSGTYDITGTSINGIICDPVSHDPVKKSFTLKIRHAANTPLKTGTVTVFDNEGNTYKSTVSDSASVAVARDSGSATGAASIPEFPTVALPVAAILGMVFIFGRKKEGL
jgi:hypothetical protein